ncbi:oligosaccharide flippase family protein [Alteromonas sp. KUL17]|uniref:oligosaccharide flippase family protein n=1 Tax=Alteromonas sp. KUL17 TaxID=2480796 RepID=UPI0013EFA886|nr:oligosaccharide flippase family protein [Alteromonas sp. KUL17]
MNIVKRSLYISSASEVINKIISFVSVVVYARLLTPTELGVFAIASSIMVFALEIKLLGTASYLIRETKIDENRVRSSLGLAITISWSLSFLLIVLSKWLSTYYELPELSTLISLLAINFLFSPFTSTIIALLSREFAFEKIVLITLPSNAIGFLITVFCIELGYSYFSLAIGQTSTAFISFVIALFVKPSLMKLIPRFSGFSSIAKVGFYTSFINLFGRLESVFADLFFGKTNGPLFVAVFSRALGFHTFVRDTLVSGISGVVLPHFSKSYREGKSPKRTYINSNVMITGFILPPMICATILSEPLILIMFGEQWLESVVYAQILGVWISVKSLSFLVNPALIILKKEKVLFWVRAGAMLSLFILIAILNDLENVNIATAFVSSAVIEFLMLYTLVKRNIGIGPWFCIRSIRKSLWLAIWCSSACYLTFFIFNRYVNNVTLIIFEALVLVPTWIYALNLLSHPLKKHLPSIPSIIKRV